MENVYQMAGYTLHLIPTNKFKTMTISLRNSERIMGMMGNLTRFENAN